MKQKNVKFILSRKRIQIEIFFYLLFINKC